MLACPRACMCVCVLDCRRCRRHRRVACLSVCRCFPHPANVRLSSPPSSSTTITNFAPISFFLPPFSSSTSTVLCYTASAPIDPPTHSRRRRHTHTHPQQPLHRTSTPHPKAPAILPLLHHSELHTASSPPCRRKQGSTEGKNQQASKEEEEVRGAHTTASQRTASTDRSQREACSEA